MIVCFIVENTGVTSLLCMGSSPANAIGRFPASTGIKNTKAAQINLATLICFKRYSNCA